MRLLLILALLGACSAPSSQAPAGDATVRGTVAAVDLSPMAYDGDGEITVETERGPVEVRVPARENLCAAAGQLAVVDLRVGDTVEVVGSTSGGAVRPCQSADHRLVVVQRAAPDAGVWRGVYESGFETSRFRPCDQPDARWWLVPNGEMAEQVAELLDTYGGDGRGRWVAVEATVEGTLGDAGQWGHLGDYDRELTVTGVREVVFLTADIEDTPACR